MQSDGVAVVGENSEQDTLKVQFMHGDSRRRSDRCFAMPTYSGHRLDGVVNR